MNEDSIIHEVLYPYPIWTVWQALTSSEALAQWFMPNDFKPIPGHHFTFQTTPRPGWDGLIECQVITVDPPHCITYSWRAGSPVLDTLVTFTLTDFKEQTHLRLEHSGFAASGEDGVRIRDILGRGWRSFILHKQLPIALAQLINK